MTILTTLILLTSSVAPLPAPLPDSVQPKSPWLEALAAPHLAPVPPTPRPGPFAEGDLPWRLTPYSIVDGSRNFDGGVRRDNSLRMLTGITGELDLYGLLGWSGATLFADLQWIAGDDGSEDVGDLQAYSNIDWFEDRFQLSEMWYEQVFEAQHLRLKLGKIDANSEFAFVDSGGDFLHSSAGFSPTIFALPTYPEPAFGGNLFAEDFSGFGLGVGVYDGTGYKTGSRGPSSLFSSPGDLFGIAEARYEWEDGRVGIGAWHHHGDFDRFDGGIDQGTEGLYALAEGWLKREDGGDPEVDQGLQAWLLLGTADRAVTPIDGHVGVGLLYTGLLDGRDEDSTGFGIHSAQLSGDPAAELTADHETAFEFFHSIQLSPVLRIQPDLQYIVNPGGQGLEDAVVGTVRLAFEL